MLVYDVVIYGENAPFCYCGYKDLEDAKIKYYEMIIKYPKNRIEIIKANIVEGTYFQNYREVVFSNYVEQVSLFDESI